MNRPVDMIAGEKVDCNCSITAVKLLGIGSMQEEIVRCMKIAMKLNQKKTKKKS